MGHTLTNDLKDQQMCLSRKWQKQTKSILDLLAKIGFLSFFFLFFVLLSFGLAHAHSLTHWKRPRTKNSISINYIKTNHHSKLTISNCTYKILFASTFNVDWLFWSRLQDSLYRPNKKNWFFLSQMSTKMQIYVTHKQNIRDKLICRP